MTFAMALALGVVSSVGGACADYQVGRGDVLEISVFGSPDLTRRTTVNIDGRIWFPLVGSVAVSGLTLAEVQAKLAKHLQDMDLVRSPQVLIEVAEYRPIYVKGDVASPGSFPYRPGMNVRQAAALAGGHHAIAKGADSAAVGADLRGEYNSLWAELVQDFMRLERLRAELDGKRTADLEPTQRGPLDPNTVATIARLEAQQLEASSAGRESTLEHLKTVLGYTDSQIATLEEQRKESEKDVALQSSEVERTQGLLGKGLTTSNRVTDEQRALASLKTQLLGNIAQLSDTRRLRQEYDHKIEETVQQRRVEVLKEVQETVVSLEKTRAKLDATRQKLAALGAAPPQGREAAATSMDVVVFRKVGDSDARIEASEETELLPGDVVEIRIQESVPSISPATIEQSEAPALSVSPVTQCGQGTVDLKTRPATRAAGCY